MRKLIQLTAVLGAAAFLAGCSSTPAGDGRDCLEVPAGIAEQIAEGSNDFPIEPTGIAAVRSEAMADANIVAMSFVWPDGESDQGVWSILGTLDDPGMTLAVDATAATVTDWPNQIDGHTFDITEDGATEALACLDQ